MRDIRFRAKSLDTHKWMYGNYVREEDTTYCFKEDYDRHPEIVHHYICYDTTTDWGLPNDHHKVEVDPFTLGEFTGCRDKHGVDIYEGDIVRKRTRDGRMHNLIVVFSYGVFGCGSSTRIHPYLLDDSNIVVMGNEYDNPELVSE